VGHIATGQPEKDHTGQRNDDSNQTIAHFAQYIF
jgi:hypothetical protein